MDVDAGENELVIPVQILEITKNRAMNGEMLIIASHLLGSLNFVANKIMFARMVRKRKPIDSRKFIIAPNGRGASA